MNIPTADQIHATCVAIDGEGVLLIGPSGSGKSDLALRLIAAGARLVADDRVDISRAADGRIEARAPDALAGKIEVRGLGILAMAGPDRAPLALACELAEQSAIQRLPDRRNFPLLGVSLPLVAIAPFEASAVTKVQLALGIATGSIMRVDDPE
jgi:HPr kinase/phosphorylase